MATEQSKAADTPTTTTRQARRPSTAERDLIILATLGMASFALVVAWGYRFNSVGGDPLIVAVLVLALAPAVYSWRRWREVRRENEVLARAEHTLLWERGFSDTILETSGSLILALDRQGHIVRFNRTCTELTGYSLEELRGRPFWDMLLLPAERDRVREVFAQLCADHFPNTHENHWVTRFGDHRLVTWANTTLLDAAGEVEYVIATGLDVTVRRENEAALAASEARFRAVFDRASIGIIIADLERHILTCNPVYEQITGYSEMELRAGTFPFATHPDDAASDMAFFRQLVAGQLSTYQLEKRYIHKDSRIVQGHLTTALVRDTCGRPHSVIGLVVDVTASKALEAGLTEAQQQLALAEGLAARQYAELRRLTSGLSRHELRILTLVAQGLSYTAIGALLHIQPATVKTHVHHIGEKLGLENRGRTAVVGAAQERGLLPPCDEGDCEQS